MVVWQADNDETTTISGRVLDSQGQPLTPEFVIASGEGASPGHPSVAALANGDFLAVWAGSDANRYGPWIRAQAFDRWGAPLAPPRIVAIASSSRATSRRSFPGAPGAMRSRGR